VKKIWSVAAVLLFFFLLSSNNPAGAFNDEATLYLAQATSEDADKRPKTSRDDILDQAKEEQGSEEDEYDDEYDDEDEYGDAEDVELIPDPWIEMNQGLYVFNDKMYFWVLKPLSTGYGLLYPKNCGRVYAMLFTISGFRCALSTVCCRENSASPVTSSVNFLSTRQPAV